LTISEKRYLLRAGSIVTCILLLVTFAVVWQVNIKDPYTGNYDEGDFLLAARQVLEGRRLFTDVFSAQPPLYLEMMTLAFRLFGDTLVVGREMTIFFSLICLATVALITWRIAGPLSVPVAIFCLGVQSQFFKDAKIAMADIPSLAYALLAMACALPTRSRRYGAWLVLAGACFALSLLTKLLPILLIMPLLFLVALSAPANEPFTWHLLSLKTGFTPVFIRRLILFAIGSVSVISFIVFRYDLFSAYDQVIHFHMVAMNVFRSKPLGNISQLGTLLMQNFGFTCLAVLGFAVLLKRNRLAAVWLALWLAAATSFIIVYTPLFSDHLVIFLPPFALLAGASIHWAPLGWQKQRWKSMTLVTLLLLSHAGISIYRDWHFLNQTAPEIAKLPVDLIQRYTHPGDIVISDDTLSVFLTRRTVPRLVCDTARTRIASGYLTDAQMIEASKDARMVLFWKHRLQRLTTYRQWVQSHFQLVQAVKNPGHERSIYEAYLDMAKGDDGHEKSIFRYSSK